MDEAKLREKLTRIEALFAGATTEGERVAAAEARRRIRKRLESAERTEPPVEFRFTLTDTADGKVLAEANRGGMLTSAWDMRLASGPARLVSAGWFNTGYQVVQEGRTTGEVNRVGLCNGGWAVHSDGVLQEYDLLFTGLIYHTILRRNAAAATAATAN